MKRELKSDRLSEPAGAFSHGIEVRMDGSSLLFFSGLTSRNRDGSVFGVGDIRAQTERCLENLSNLLEDSGAGFDDVVAVTLYVLNMSQFDAVHDVRRRYFREPFPSSTMVEVSRLAAPDMLIEITAIAARPAS